jgi:CHAT domain-containing protein/tetratricopeptide (TPR) repeat protein
MKHLFFLLVFGFPLYLFAQSIPSNPNLTDKNGKRQGKWTILYDKEWKIIQDPLNAQFYRLITYKDDKPMGRVYDMYANGKIQMETTLTSDRPQDVMNGKTIFYNEKGEKQKIQVFENGILVDEVLVDVKGREVLEKWKSLDSLGTVYNKQKNYAQAFEVWERAKLKAAKEFGKKHENYATALKQLGDFFQSLGRYPQAEPYFIALVATRKESLGSKHHFYGKALNSLAINYYYMGNLQKAESLFLEVKEVYKIALGENHLDYAGILSNLGIINYDRADYDKAEKYYLEALHIREKLVGKDHLDYAGSLTTLGNLYNSKGEYKRAKEMFETATKIYKAKENPFYPLSLTNLSMAYRNLNDYKKAESLLQESLKFTKDSKGVKHPNYANALGKLGEIYLLVYKFEQSKSALTEAAQLKKELLGEKHPQYADVLQTLSSLYIALNDYAQAEELMLQVLQIRKEVFGEKNPKYASALANLATFYLRVDDYLQAETFFNQGLNIIKETAGKNNIDYAGFLNNLGVLYYNFNNYPKAEECYQEALSIRGNLLGKEHPEYAVSLITLANVYISSKKDINKAEAMLRDVLKIYKKNKAEKTVNYAAALSTLSTIKKAQKDYKQAKDLLLESIHLRKTISADQGNDFTLTLNNLSIIYQIQKEYKKSDSLLLLAAQMTKNITGEKNRLYNLYINNLAINQENMGNLKAAFDYRQETADIYLARIEDAFPAMSQKEKSLFLKDIKENIEASANFTNKALAFNVNATGWFYNYILATKGILLNNQNKIRDRILASKDTSLQNLYQAWQAKRNILAQVYQMPIEEKKSRGLDEKQLEEDANRLEKEISGKSELFAQTNDKKRYTWQEVQKNLKKGEAAIEMIKYRKTNADILDTLLYAVLVITPQHKDNPEMLILDNGNDLEAKHLKNYQNSIIYQKTDKLSYQQYWKKIADVLYKYKIKKVYLAPDGVYNQINISTLQNPTTLDYVADEIEIQILGNTKELVMNPREKKITIQNGVFIGYPDYETTTSNPEETKKNRPLSPNNTTRGWGKLRLDSTQRFFDGSKVIELPGTKIEVENIQAIFNKNKIKSEVYLAEKASESLVKKLQSPQILHIATHGFFLENIEDNDSKEGTRAIMGTDNQKVLENPLLRSGLLFAGASQALSGQNDEGILTSFEATNLDLDNTELVVMSACETGLGVISNGEGVYGLQRAFQVAGARTILMSLWTVSDAATKDLMTLFYENWVTKKQLKREAFRNAQKELKKKYPQPYYWGAFVMVGE